MALEISDSTKWTEPGTTGIPEDSKWGNMGGLPLEGETRVVLMPAGSDPANPILYRPGYSGRKPWSEVLDKIAQSAIVFGEITYLGDADDTYSWYQITVEKVIPVPDTSNTREPEEINFLKLGVYREKKFTETPDWLIVEACTKGDPGRWALLRKVGRALTLVLYCEVSTDGIPKIFLTNFPLASNEMSVLAELRFPLKNVTTPLVPVKSPPPVQPQWKRERNERVRESILIFFTIILAVIGILLLLVLPVIYGFHSFQAGAEYYLACVVFGGVYGYNFLAFPAGEKMHMQSMELEDVPKEKGQRIFAFIISTLILIMIILGVTTRSLRILPPMNP
ncbi:MAG: hypothetical protein GY765_18150 [bacterium]|nr:hypothetical protein [bacterium]